MTSPRLSPSIILYGGPHSPFVRKVLVTAVESGVIQDMKLMRVNPPLTMATPNPAFMRINPLGKVPTLVLPDGRTLFDSDVICDYLDATFGGGRLYPPEGPARWRALRWNALGDGAMDALILWRFERNKAPEIQWANVLSSFEAKLQSILTAIESEMAEISAAPLGIGHISMACFLGYLDHRFADLDWRASFKATADWFLELNQRESLKLSRHGDAPAAGSDPPMLGWE
jgi:glutathione S-transferase